MFNILKYKQTDTHSYLNLSYFHCKEDVLKAVEKIKKSDRFCNVGMWNECGNLGIAIIAEGDFSKDDMVSIVICSLIESF